MTEQTKCRVCGGKVEYAIANICMECADNQYLGDLKTLKGGKNGKSNR